MIDKLKKNITSIKQITDKLRDNLKPVQTGYARFVKKKVQYINSFCNGKRQVSNKELLYLLEQYEIFKTVLDKKRRE